MSAITAGYYNDPAINWGGMVKSDARIQAEAEAAKGNNRLLKTLGKIAIRVAIIAGLSIGGVALIDGGLELAGYDSLKEMYGETTNKVAKATLGVLAGMADVPGHIIDFFTTDGIGAEAAIGDLATSTESLREQIEGLPAGDDRAALLQHVNDIEGSVEAIEGMKEAIKDPEVYENPDLLAITERNMMTASANIEKSVNALTADAEARGVELEAIKDGSGVFGFGKQDVGEAFAGNLEAFDKMTPDITDYDGQHIRWGRAGLAAGAGYLGAKSAQRVLRDDKGRCANCPPAPPRDIVAAYGPRTQAFQDRALMEHLAEHGYAEQQAQPFGRA